MTKQEILEVILTEKLVAIIRLKTTVEVPGVVAALVEGGIKVLEITTNTPDYLHHISQARKTYPTNLIGAGTVLHAEHARAAIEAGAQFLVTPNTNPEIVDIASRENTPVLMGAYTATEIAKASESGADIVKLFPANFAGIPYMKAVTAPLDGIKVFAVGGVNAENASEWLEAGAAGLGIGSQLIAKKDDGRLDSAGTIKNASQLLALIKSQ